MAKPIPVILDTDLGDDIDDTWALAMLLKCPELDLRMVCADYGDTPYRARLIAKLLETAGRTDIPVAVGPQANSKGQRQAAWLDGYELSDYPGTVHDDGVDALINAIMQADEPLPLICIGPVPNIAEALRREPGIAERAHFVGMHGCIKGSHRPSGEVIAEWNVVADPASFQAVVQAPWKSMTFTPLDTCAKVRLEGEAYQQVRECQEPLMRAVMENYTVWAEGQNDHDPEKESSILFDTVAVHLAFSTQYLHMRRMGWYVTDDGFTIEDENGPEVNAALEWEDLEAYHTYLADRLTGKAET
jgi:inosine-uridine nucleoside N-ribohydrolase